jgi:hypothetical protein
MQGYADVEVMRKLISNPSCHHACLCYLVSVVQWFLCQYWRRSVKGTNIEQWLISRWIERSKWYWRGATYDPPRHYSQPHPLLKPHVTKHNDDLPVWYVSHSGYHVIMARPYSTSNIQAMHHLKIYNGKQKRSLVLFSPPKWSDMIRGLFLGNKTAKSWN